MIWIIGGTSEGREIVDKIRDLEDYLVTIATDEGKEFLNSERVFIGRMDYDAMMRFGKANSVKLIVDLSHPYAKIVSENARTVARNLKIKYIRYVRENTEFTPNTIYLRNYEEAYKYLSKVSGTVFFTTGSKNIGDFEKIKGSNRFIYRI
ncbi:MAG: precorrin-6A/cobalt-precorrin-6A reductase, partial [Tissierellaceae bacterium]